MPRRNSSTTRQPFVILLPVQLIEAMYSALFNRASACHRARNVWLPPPKLNLPFTNPSIALNGQGRHWSAAKVTDEEGRMVIKPRVGLIERHALSKTGEARRG
jgi:hypothetical protein